MKEHNKDCVTIFNLPYTFTPNHYSNPEKWALFHPIHKKGNPQSWYVMVLGFEAMFVCIQSFSLPLQQTGISV